MRMKEKVYQIGSVYFYQIHYQMFSIKASVPSGDQVMKDKIELVMMDLRFLKLFCWCFEAYNLTSHEQSKERLISMMTPFEVIWAKDEDILDRLKAVATRRRKGLIMMTPLEVIWANVQELRLMMFELEGRIHQSKLLIERYGDLLHSLMQMQMQLQCKTTSIMNENLKHEKIRQVNMHLRFLEDYQLLSAEIVPFKNHIGILSNMAFFLQESLKIVRYCTEWKNCIEFLNFARAFSIKAVYWAFLYWAKEANGTSASTEMNNVPFAMMMLEFIPCMPHVTKCYFDILCCTGNLPSSILLEETVADVVDFFFEHMATTLKDDFPIFRDRLINVYTFITDHLLCENAKEEVRNQIYALFQEDAYLLLSFDEMKEDFSNNNMILRDFMNKIEISNANIRQRYYLFSYSWIGSEAVKMDYLYLAFVQRALCAIEEDAPWRGLVQSQLQIYRMELRFIKASLLWFAMLDDSDEEIKVRLLSSLIVSLQRIWSREVEEKGFLVSRLDTIRKGGHSITGWHPLASELEGKIELSKLEISTHLVNEFHWSLPSKPSTSNKILKFLDSILHNLNALTSCIPGKIVPFRKQIETLEDKLAFLQNMLKLAENCIDNKDLGDFIMLVQVFANEAARLTIMYWVREANDKIATEIHHILSHMLQKIKPTTPDVARLYFETLKAIYLKRSDPLLFGQTASIFVDFAFEDLLTLHMDDFQALRDDVIFLLTFLNDPPYGNNEELVCSQIDNSFWEDVYGLLSIDDMKGDFSEKKVLLGDFMMKIKIVNANIQKLYCEFSDSSVYNFPTITSPWYLDFVIHNLRNSKERMITDRTFALFVKYKIIKFEEELVSLSPFFNYVFKLQKVLNDTWLQVVDLVHLTERVINSCISSWFVFDHQVWYYMAYLSHVFDRIKVIKTKIEKIKENSMHNVSFLPHSTGVIGTHSKQAWTSKIDEVVVGFEDEAKIIIEDLTSEHKSLDIVSIVGMGGLGKTTLARKVSSTVKDHFHILAFYTVSQDHNIRMLLLGILKYIINIDDEISRMTNDDLSHKLWKCLSHQKYLIVLDDVWNTSVWNEVKRSFPDDQSGSRVMITTRFRDVANKCKIQCSPFHLRFLSKVECWKLLQMKVFQNGISPPNLSNIGRQIAESCNGLPLSIVVIAGILTRIERSESSWREIAEKVYSSLSDEGCIQILELSYNHLPEYLKICLLYLGAFPEDKLFRVNQVVRLWIAEGFVHEHVTKSVEDVAKEYFHDLVDRSLIVVSARGSDGEIKTFSVHDLIHKLCQTKCQEGNFFKLERGIPTSSSMYDHYRTSILLNNKIIKMCSGSSSHGNASTLLLFGHQVHDSLNSLMLKHKLAQVLYVEDDYRNYTSTEIQMVEDSLLKLTTVVNMRHIEYVTGFKLRRLPPSISNFWNLQSLIINVYPGEYPLLPKTLWKMKSLRHVDVKGCMLQFSDCHEHEQLDKVVSFSRPLLYSGKDVERLLQRLTVVGKLGIELAMSFDYDYDTLDFFKKLESLKIIRYGLGDPNGNLINFPSTLKKLTLDGLGLPRGIMSSIAELHCLQVLKLRHSSFTGPILKMEDVAFKSLVFFELVDRSLIRWNASTESFPCLEQLWIGCEELKELPPCFGEVSTLKRIAISKSSPRGVVASAFQIREELMDLGNEVEVTIEKLYYE